MYAIYAFCRIVDDIADEGGALPDKLHALAEWRHRIAGLYEGRSEDAVTRIRCSGFPLPAPEPRTSSL